MQNISIRFVKRRWVLKWMSAVGIEETATVRSELLDELLRSNRALRDGLLGNRVHHRLAVGAHRWLAIGSQMRNLLRLHDLHRVVRLQVLHNPLRHQHQAPTTQNGSSTHSVQRTKSTQKFPIVFISRRAMPRINAIASAMPVAAETKL